MNQLKLDVRVNGCLFINNKLLIVQRAAHEDSDPNCWELPAGAVEPGEDPDLAILREMQEETSYSELKIVSITGTSSVIYPTAAPAFHTISIDYLLERQEGDFVEPTLTDDHQAWRLINVSELEKLEPVYDQMKSGMKRAFETRHRLLH